MHKILVSICAYLGESLGLFGWTAPKKQTAERSNWYHAPCGGISFIGEPYSSNHPKETEVIKKKFSTFSSAQKKPMN